MIITNISFDLWYLHMLLNHYVEHIDYSELDYDLLFESNASDLDVQF